MENTTDKNSLKGSISRQKSAEKGRVWIALTAATMMVLMPTPAKKQNNLSPIRCRPTVRPGTRPDQGNKKKPYDTDNHRFDIKV